MPQAESSIPDVHSAGVYTIAVVDIVVVVVVADVGGTFADEVETVRDVDLSLSGVKLTVLVVDAIKSTVAVDAVTESADTDVCVFVFDDSTDDSVVVIVIFWVIVVVDIVVAGVAGVAGAVVGEFVVASVSGAVVADIVVDSVAGVESLATEVVASSATKRGACVVTWVPHMLQTPGQ